jgi:ligand-binding sensor domain-containing protein
MRLIWRIFLLSFIVLFSAKSQDINFKHLSAQDGLASDMVNTIFQDSDGFMWFGTKNGLSRFDGYSFLNFKYDETDSNSLSNDFVTCIVEDKNQNLWIGTFSGLNFLERNTYQIKRVEYFGEHSFAEQCIRCLIIDHENKVWVSTLDSGLYSVSIDNARVLHHNLSSSTFHPDYSNRVHACLLNNKNELLFGTDQGLYKYSANTKAFEVIVPDMSINCLTYFNDSSVLIGTVDSESFYYRMFEDGKLVKQRYPNSMDTYDINALVDKEGNRWITSRDYGLIYYDVKKQKTNVLKHDKYVVSSLSSNFLISIFEDNSQNLWVGTRDAGLNIYQKFGKSFIHIN